MTSILIFDSGSGGLSVAKEIVKAIESTNLLPTNIFYLADDLYFPYGEQDESSVLSRVHDCILRAESRLKPDILVVACNTASTIVLPELRKHLSVPVVGVVPAIKPASKASKKSHIGLLATPATISRSYTDELIKQFAEGVSVTKVGSTKLVEMAEKAVSGQTVDLSKIKEIVSPFLEENKVDVIVLGCTHFPLLKSQIRQVVENRIELIDSGEAIARRVIHLLGAEVSKEKGSGCGISFSLMYTQHNQDKNVWRKKLENILPADIQASVVLFD